MLPLERLEALDQQLSTLLAGLPVLSPGAIASPATLTRLHGDLASFWAAADAHGSTRKQQLASLRQQQLLAELELRLADQTLNNDAIGLLRTCLALPLAWQRQHLPAAQRPEVYRPLFSTASPNRRQHLRGAVVIVANGPQGLLENIGAWPGTALLCSLSHGIEAFASLTELHVELCERLDDPLQCQPLLQLTRAQDQPVIVQADRLRYDWYTDDLITAQLQALLDHQRERLSQALLQPPQAGQAALGTRIGEALNLMPLLGSKPALATRYALLLEKHMPHWLRALPPHQLAHIMQTLQELAGAITLAGAPGILTSKQFQQRHTLLAWVTERLNEQLRREPLLDRRLNAEDIHVSVTLAQRIGPLVNPLSPSSYIPAASRPQVGATIELVPVTYRLAELALLNIGWFDLDYWVSARIHTADGREISGLSPARVKALIRELDAGSSYQRFIRKHLLDAPAAQWRMESHSRINRARMQAEAAKARYAGHFLAGPEGMGYRWARLVLDYPDSQSRPTLDAQRISVRQLLIQGHTVQGVLLLNAEDGGSPALVLYTPDAPDRRPWREYPSIHALMRALRGSTALRQYVVQRMPLANAESVDKLLRKGRLSADILNPTITGDLFRACYRAEVHALMAQADAHSRSNAELIGQVAIDALHLLLDLVSLVLPFPAVSALAFGRAAIAVWDGFEAMQEDDREAALHHALAALSHTTDGLNSFAGSALVRRSIRGIPPRPPAPLPKTYAVTVDQSKLRYRIDGVHGEGVYERIGAQPGLGQYFIRDDQGRFYHVSFDGRRWRATDPRQPDAYVQLPLARREDGSWVVDSGVAWLDGVPDLQPLLDACRLQPARAGAPVSGEAQLYDAAGQLYVQLQGQQLPVRRHLLAGHYTLQLAPGVIGQVPAWAVLRRGDDGWRIQVRQPGRSSGWLPLPGAYSASRGSS